MSFFLTDIYVTGDMDPSGESVQLVLNLGATRGEMEPGMNKKI